MIQKYATLIAFSQIVLNFDKNRQKIDFSDPYRFPGLNGEIDLASLIRTETFFVSTYKTFNSCNIKANQTIMEKFCSHLFHL